MRLPGQHVDEHERLIRDPTRDQANAAVRDADEALTARAERELAGLLANQAITPTTKSAHVRPAAKDHPRAPRRRSSRRHSRPASPSTANSPADAIRTQRENTLYAPASAACRWSCRLYAHRTPALAIRPPQRLAAPKRRQYPRHHPPDHHPRPLASTITWTPAAITVTLKPAGTPASPAP